jgi:hypothetical protein
MGGCVNLLHHLGKDPSRGGRGSSAIGGSHDFSVTAEKQADGTFKVGPGPGDKTRDQAAGSIRSICFRLERYVLDAARDLHGDPWESAYAVECREVPKVQDNRKGLVFWNQAFFRVSVGGRASEPEMRRVFLEIYPSETQKGKETAWQREKAQHTISMDGDLRFYADESPEGMFGPPLNP